MGHGWVIAHPTANKSHHCSMCSRVIDKGETYLRGAGFDGNAWTWKECAHCESVRRLYDISDGDGYDPDMFYGWSDSPQDVTELRHAAGYRMKWRTRSGSLLPIPRTEDA